MLDNWDVDIYYTEKYWDVNDVISMEWTECGPVRATLEMERKGKQFCDPPEDPFLCRQQKDRI